MTQRPRKILRIYPAIPTSEGAGVNLKRSIGTPQLDNLDPFLLLDQFDTENADDYIAGFPDHPHRGFETVTYMIAGLMRHEDNTGAGIYIRGYTNDLVFENNVIRETRPSGQQTQTIGIRIDEHVGNVVMEDNVI
ncbi:MAG: pirin family protein, partial [Rhodospirillales bacterium]|nr:pirin family protein [Rhodospirillales bacterium]